MADRVQVCWLVPGFPADSEDPNYSFLGREAAELCETNEVDLTVVTDDIDGPAAWGRFEVLQLERPTTNVEKLATSQRAIRADPSRILSTIGKASETYPTLWRVGSAIDLTSDRPVDVVHSHFAEPRGTCGVPLARYHKAASIVSLRGVDLSVDPELNYGYRLEPRFERELRRSVVGVDRCLTATKRMRELAISAGAPHDRTTVLSNSFSATATREQIDTVPGAKATIVSVGRLVDIKGFDRGIRALAELPEDHHYVIIGDGPARSELLKLAMDLGVEHRLHLMGRTSPATAKAWLHAADVVWFLSRVEAFGNVLLEAFDAGSAIIATRTGVAPDLLIDDAGSSLLDDADDPEELARKTRAASRVETASRTLKLRQFSAIERSARLLDIYRSAVEGA